MKNYKWKMRNYKRFILRCFRGSPTGRSGGAVADRLPRVKSQGHVPGEAEQRWNTPKQRLLHLEHAPCDQQPLFMLTKEVVPNASCKKRQAIWMP